MLCSVKTIPSRSLPAFNFGAAILRSSLVARSFQIGLIWYFFGMLICVLVLCTYEIFRAERAGKNFLELLPSTSNSFCVRVVGLAWSQYSSRLCSNNRDRFKLCRDLWSAFLRITNPTVLRPFVANKSCLPLFFSMPRLRNRYVVVRGRKLHFERVAAGGMREAGSRSNIRCCQKREEARRKCP